VPQVTREGEDDRVSGTDADRHDDIYHNGSSWFGGGTDSAETADLARVLINAQSAAPRFSGPFTSVVQKNAKSISKKHSHFQKMRVDQITRSEICVILVVTPSRWSS